MSLQPTLLLGTRKGAFLLDGDGARRSWRLRGPMFEPWPINHVIADPASGALLAAGGDAWFGPAVWRSEDDGASWTHSSEGLAYPAGADPIVTIWSLAAAGGRIFAGVQPAGLFVSEDGGRTWAPVEGLNAHPTRGRWHPGGAGLILHHIVVDRADPRRMWIGISAAGVFYSEDGGETWTPRNAGTRNDYAPEGEKYAEVGQCVHSISQAAGDPNRLYQQNHCGMYRSDDGGAQWVSIEAGLPSTFGFPAAAHPRERDTVYLLPLNGDQAGRFMPDAACAVWRSRDAGATWSALREGLPQESAYFGVLRQAMAVDPLTPAGVYFGTSSGSVYASADEGESWTRIAENLPTVASVEVRTRRG